MATLTLDRVWINLMSTGEAVSAISKDRARGAKADGDVRTYAGGRQRAITTEGVKEQFGVTLRELPLVTVEKLKSWIGQSVQLRDHRGQRFFGVFFSVTPIEWQDKNIYDAAIVLHVETVAEGV